MPDQSRHPDESNSPDESNDGWGGDGSLGTGARAVVVRGRGLPARVRGAAWRARAPG